MKTDGELFFLIVAGLAFLQVSLCADIPDNQGQDGKITEPNTFIVLFRNETTLLVQLKPPKSEAVYSHYKVSINPPDAEDSVLNVKKESESPEPAQAAFNGLMPGKAYNISVQTVSGNELSAPTIAEYRTVPLKPQSISFDKITPHSFVVHWEPPSEDSEFDKYQVTLETVQKSSPVTISKDDPTFLEFKDNLEPGKTYSVVVRTVSGKVISLPASADVTTIHKDV